MAEEVRNTRSTVVMLSLCLSSINTICLQSFVLAIKGYAAQEKQGSSTL